MTSIGIDLGTTNTVASHTVGGAPEVLPNREDKPLTPSVVGFRRTPAGGDYLVGSEAVRYAHSAPRDTVYSTKRLIGLDYHDERVQQVRRKVGYDIVSGRGAPGDTAACVRIGGRPHTPTEVATLILRRVVADAAARLERPVNAGTITVPAYFEDCQKNATREAGERAGLALRPLLPEPIAAALAFTLRDRARAHRILVYDLGGGTFDASVVELAGAADAGAAGKSLQVLATRGDMWLGGDDFDLFLAARIHDWLTAKYDFDSRADPTLRGIVRGLAEAAKVELSGRDEVAVCEPNVYSHPGKGAVSVNLTVTRREFEQDIEPLLRGSLAQVEQLLVDAGVPADKLTAVVLAGGSTCVPLVRKLLRDRFGAGKVRTDVDPMRCVSLGAAVWNERFPLAGGVLVLDRLGDTGIPTAMPYGVQVYKDHNPQAFEVVVPANTPYPTAEPFRKTFRPTADNQRQLVVPVYEGTAADTAHNRCQGVITVPELPVGVGKNTEVLIEFSIDVHGTLTVAVAVPTIGFHTRAELRRNQSAPPAAPAGETADWAGGVRNSVEWAREFLKEYGELLTAKDREGVEQLCADAAAALADDDPVRGGEFRSRVWVAVLETGTPGVLMLAGLGRAISDGKRARVIEAMALALWDRARVRVREEASGGGRDAVAVALAAEAEVRDELFHLLEQVFAKRDEQSGPLPGQLTTW